MRVRRVVTGHDADGKAVIASDTEIDGLRPTLTPGAEFHRLWGGDETPRFPDNGSPPAHHSYFPPVGGFRFAMFAIPPRYREGSAPPTDLAGALAEFDTVLPGLTGYLEPDAPGMHTTDTIDFEVVLEGDIWLDLDNGVEVHLRAGDTVVQNGTRHAWRNHGDTIARVAVFMVGADHERVRRQ